jgi:hypothetical protein
MKPRALLLAGFAVHLASLLLPFDSFKCDAPQSFFSLGCAIPGYVYFAFCLLNPSRGVLLFVLACVWLVAVLTGLPFAVFGRLRRSGVFASLLLVPSYVAVVAAMSPHRWLGPMCAGIGAFLVVWGGIASRQRLSVEGGGPRRGHGDTPNAIDETRSPGGA